MLSIHDAEIISYSFDLEKLTLDLIVNIVFPKNEGKKAKISFSGVIAYKFDEDIHGNWIFSVDKYDYLEYFSINEEYVKEKLVGAFSIFNHSVTNEEKFENLKKYLEENEIFVYDVSYIFGEPGLVFAKNMEIIEIPST